jgi:hypothetical protein
VTYTATDALGATATATQLVTVFDDTAPSITAPVDVTVGTGAGATSGSALVSDSLLGSASSIDNCPGAPTIARTGVPAGNLFPLGATTVAYTATDAAGNTASAVQTVTVVDDTSPTIIATVTPASPNANGWNSTPVTVSFTCADNVGIVSCTTPILLGEGADQTATGTASDAAGNTATATVTHLNIDLTKPVISFNGNAGLYAVDETVAITCSATDALSLIATATCPDATGPAYAFGLGSHTLNATATDRAGNTQTASTTFTVGVTEEALCALVQRFVNKTGVAGSLCAKLDAAAAARDRGNSRTEHNILKAFANEVNAQRDKSISPADADLLLDLASAL